ncbi:MAG: winged helix DNA-binding domain-containing protein [Anaerolineales bacterium]|nr:winged helix DNA-binding domain-containing protein [Anaerolineales bacterium]
MIRATPAQAAHFILTKNYLAAGKAAGVVPFVGELVGLPAAPSPAPFLAAYSRLASFTPTDLLAELYQKRSLIQSTLMRSVPYIVPVERFAALHAATARQRNQDFNSEFRLWGLDNSEVEALEQAILASGDWPAPVEAISARLPQSLPREVSQTSRGGRVSTTSNVALVLRWLVAKGVLSASPAEIKDVSGFANLTRLTQELLYAPLAAWYPELDLSAVPSEAEAQAALAQAYLAAFGPASEADISFWTGFGKSETARAVGALAAKTTLVLVEGIPGMLLLLKAQAEAFQTTQPPTQPVINILPADDPFTTAHRASRSRYFSDQKLQRHIFSSTGAAEPAIVVNGQIVGTWAWAGSQLTWRLLVEIDPALLPLIQIEIERVGAFIQPGLAIIQQE